MAVGWSGRELERIATAGELEISNRRSDGTLRGWVPIRVVSADGDVFVRTWHRRDTAELRAAVDAACRAEYGRDGSGSAGGMVSDESAAATLRLLPDREGVATAAG